MALKNVLSFKNEFELAKLLEVINSLIFINVTTHFLFSFQKDFSLERILLIFAALYLVSFKYSSLKKIKYTFWTFSLVFFLWLLFYLVYFWDQNIILIQLITCLTLTLFEVSLVNTPIYYPRINWWEYDFRYRYDLKLKLELNEKTVDARLTDLRKKSACIVVFENLELNSEVSFELVDHELPLRGKVITVKEPNPGRGFYYGVKLIEDNSYFKLEQLWKSYRKVKLRKRFKINNA